MPHRLTIRLDEEAWATLTRICEKTGVSATAFVQGVIQEANPIWEAEDWKHPLEWRHGPVRDAIVAAVDSARRIDIDRRRRG
ncbi:MAG TPA: hypothetical protein VFK42_14715 [Acidimicrobiales bacterium]|nr:hypothetical protein [Acidimicrobiales bacterium]